MHFLNILVTACLLPLHLPPPFEIMCLARLQTRCFVLKSKRCCHTVHVKTLLSWFDLKCSRWLLSFFLLVLFCRCLTTPPNPSRRRLTVTPQMASLYSSSLMPAPSPSRWYPAWGKKWSVTVTQWAIFLTAGQVQDAESCCLSEWLVDRVHVTISTSPQG